MILNKINNKNILKIDYNDDKFVCKYIFKKGVNKGNRCFIKSYENSIYCKKHLKLLSIKEKNNKENIKSKTLQIVNKYYFNYKNYKLNLSFFFKILFLIWIINTAIKKIIEILLLFYIGLIIIIL